VRVRGVRAAPGGWVAVQELTDGWATFPDQGAGNRRWQRAGVGLLLVLLGAEFVAERIAALAAVVVPIGWAVLFLFVALVVSDEVADDRNAVRRWRARTQALLRAGGRDALRRAVRQHGPARTVGELNILLSELGRTDPVFSARRVRRVAVHSRRWQTTVEVELTGGRQLRYRVRGLRGPARLARVFSDTSR
jgi:hypothetical protein